MRWSNRKALRGYRQYAIERKEHPRLMLPRRRTCQANHRRMPMHIHTHNRSRDHQNMNTKDRLASKTRVQASRAADQHDTRNPLQRYDQTTGGALLFPTHTCALCAKALPSVLFAFVVLVRSTGDVDMATCDHTRGRLFCLLIMIVYTRVAFCFAQCFLLLV